MRIQLHTDPSLEETVVTVACPALDDATARLLLFTACLLPLWAGLIPFLGIPLTAGFAGFAALLLAEGAGLALYERFSRVRGRRYDRRLREYQARPRQ